MASETSRAIHSVRGTIDANKFMQFDPSVDTLQIYQVVETNFARANGVVCECEADHLVTSVTE
jgi:hypothetical protein